MDKASRWIALGKGVQLSNQTQEHSECQKKLLEVKINNIGIWLCQFSIVGSHRPSQNWKMNYLQAGKQKDTEASSEESDLCKWTCEHSGVTTKYPSKTNQRSWWLGCLIADTS